MKNNFKKSKKETSDEYCHRLSSMRKDLGLTWYELANIINEELGQNLTPDAYRNKEKNYLKNDLFDLAEEDEITNIINENRKKYFNSDQRVETNALLRRISREETLKEIAIASASLIAKKKNLLSTKQKQIKQSSKVSGLLCLSDWHYGIDVDTVFNKYNTKIAKERIEHLRDAVLNYGIKENISDLYIANLGDMISGNIHYQTRLYNQIDVISQVIEVAEILTEFIYSLSEHFNIIHYYSVIDNHSRFNPDKKEHIQLESLTRIIDWYLKERLSGIVNFHENTFGIDILSIDVYDFKILGVHGDKDKQKTLISKLSSYTQNHYDLIVSAHTHHFSADELNMTEWLCNGSLMGTDQYASDLRLNSKPSQNLIIMTPENVTSAIYKIKL